MPTIEVTSNPLTPSARLKAALRLTRWMAAHGSRAAHVVVSFRTAEPMAYFAGGMPLTAYEDGDGQESRASWASVVCHIHPDRDPAYCDELALEIAQALGVERTDGHLTVRFEPTRPDRVFYLHDGTITSGAPATVGRDTEKGLQHARP